MTLWDFQALVNCAAVCLILKRLRNIYYLSLLSEEWVWSLRILQLTHTLAERQANWHKPSEMLLKTSLD